MVIWITGLASSGKTTVGRLVAALWREGAPHTVLVDGDDVRRVFDLADAETLYTLEGRRMVAERIHALCAWLDSQGINVVCCTISLFDDLHRRNRSAFSRYFEVYIEVPMEVLVRRDNKDLYDRARRGEIANVMGVDLPFTPPARPDLVIDNAADHADLGGFARDILDRALES